MFKDAGQLAYVIDHTLVRPDASLDDLSQACEEAKKYGFACIVVNSCHVARARDLLSGSLVKVCCVVGFPHGMSTTTVKIVEAMEAVKNGAVELDIVMNIGSVKSGRLDTAEVDIKNVIAMTPQKVHKVIIEIGRLTSDEIVKVCQIALRSQAEFIKTSTGYGPRDTTANDVKQIRQMVGTACRVKAAGGIKDLAAVKAMIEAGAERIGTSHGVKIMEEFFKQTS